MAEQHAVDIATPASELSAADKRVAASISAATAPLAEVQFTESPTNGVQALDSRMFKQGPPIPIPGTPDDPAGNSGPSGSDIAGVTKGLPQGTKPNIKMVQTQQQLDDLYKWATENGRPVTNPYGQNPGTAYVLPDGTRVGMRDASGSTKLPAIDINYPGRGWEKIHINPTEGAAPKLPPRIVPALEPPPVVRAPVPEPPPVEGLPRVGGMPIGGAPIGPVGPTLVPLPHSIPHLPILGEDDVNAP